MRVRPSSLAKYLCLATIVFFWLSPAQAQSVTNENNTGYPQNAIIQGTEIESVQPTNGNLHIQIPVYRSKGRGLDVAFSFILDNKGWGYTTQCGMGTCTDHPNPDMYSNVSLALHESDYHLSYKGSAVVCSGITEYSLRSNIVLSEPNGTKHHFLPDPVKSSPNVADCDTSGPTYTSTLYTNDSSGFIANIDPTTLQILSVIGKDGGRRDGPIVDNNGNTFSNGDTLGRTVNNDGSYLDTSGTLRSTSIVYTSVPVQLFPFCAFSQADQCTVFLTSISAPSSITLPNGMVYSFTYAQDGGGEPLTMTLPTGGQVKWTWGAWDTGGRRVASREVISNGVDGTWNYAYVPAAGGHTLTSVTVTDPVGNDTLYTCSLQSSYTGAIRPCYVGILQKYSGHVAGNQIIKTVSTDYQVYPWPNNYQMIVPIRETSTWNQTGQIRKAETDFDTLAVTGGTATWNNPIETREYDFPAGTALLRRTHYNYLHLQNATYRAKNIANRATSKIVYNGQGSIVAQTTYTYDGTSVQPTSGAPGHDYTNYSSTNNIRGNLTQTSRWLNPGGTWLNSNNTYNDLGDLLSTTDPLGHLTSYDYTDNFTDGVNRSTGAFITKITYPVTSGVQHVEKKQYYFNIGPVAATCGQNYPSASACTNTASLPQPDYMKFTYDLMNRPANVTRGDTGQTNFSYNDTVLPLSISSTQTISTGMNLGKTIVLDGMGRIGQSELTSDPDGTVNVAVIYDAFGRVNSVTNPYRQSGTLVTSYVYDPLGRTCVVVGADGTTVPSGVCPSTSPVNDIFTVYTGSATTVNDEAGVTRKSVSDGLGRLTQVFEAPATWNYETDYSYDALNNLLSVSQKGGSAISGNWRPRTFTYDSLSRLLCASNPENSSAACPAAATLSYTAGTTGYAYDANGNVTAKTSPAPNQTGTATVVVSYCYDALNRLISKAYTSQSCPMASPAATYSYDQGAVSAHSVGRRSGMTETTTGSEIWTYDIMGRIATDQRTTNAVTKTTSYTYNFVDSITTITYPSGHLFTYAYGAAARPLSVADTTAGITFNSGAHYAPQGELAALTSGTNLFSTYIFNSRLQPCWSYTTTGTALPWSTTICTTPVAAASILDLKYNFNLNASDNGNVVGITNNRDTTRSQNFSYDRVNRLTLAQTTSTFSTSPTNCWGEAYQYDNQTTGGGWGNLTNIAAPPSYVGCTQESGLSVTALANNRLSGNSYDAAGNTTSTPSPPATFTYDSENRMASTAGVTYTYDGDGKRVRKSNGKLYWYDTNGNVIAETDASGNITDSYVFFAGRRVVHRTSAGGIYYDFGDNLGTSRAIVQSGLTTPCYDADFYPFGGERSVANTCGESYKFEGKERDAESGNDDFGARSYTSRLGRWLSADWSAIPAPVPYANLSNPQTLDLYAMVRDNPETFADLDGHVADMAMVWPLTQSDGEPGTNNAQQIDQQRQAGLTPIEPVTPTPLPLPPSGPVTELPVLAPAGGAAAGAIVGGLVIADAVLLVVDAVMARKLYKAEKASEINGRSLFKILFVDERTPTTNPEDFERVRGTPAERNKYSGEIWIRDTLHRDHFEVYRRLKDYENGKRDRAVNDDGTLRKKF